MHKEEWNRGRKKDTEKDGWGDRNREREAGRMRCTDRGTAREGKQNKQI